jgi:hypothetical protein
MKKIVVFFQSDMSEKRSTPRFEKARAFWEKIIFKTLRPLKLEKTNKNATERFKELGYALIR